MAENIGQMLKKAANEMGAEDVRLERGGKHPRVTGRIGERPLTPFHVRRAGLQLGLAGRTQRPKRPAPPAWVRTAPVSVKGRIGQDPQPETEQSAQPPLLRQR